MILNKAWLLFSYHLAEDEEEDGGMREREIRSFWAEKERKKLHLPRQQWATNQPRVHT